MTKDSCSCGGVEWVPYIDVEGVERWKECECLKTKQYQRILDKSGIAEQLRIIGLKDYEPYEEQTKEAKEAAARYIKNFDEIKSSKHNSIAFLGQSGSGKTHLTFAIGNNLMKRNIPVLYMPYVEVIKKLKQCAMDAENYQREIEQYKRAPVLLIDDLYKGVSPKQDSRDITDIKYIIEIINYRSLGRLPIVVSSECLDNELLRFDEATGGRILEMCQDYTVRLTKSKLNYRLYGKNRGA